MIKRPDSLVRGRDGTNLLAIQENRYTISHIGTTTESQGLIRRNTINHASVF